MVKLHLDESGCNDNATITYDIYYLKRSFESAVLVLSPETAGNLRFLAIASPVYSLPYVWADLLQPMGQQKADIFGAFHTY